MTQTTGDFVVTVICAVCDKKSPFRGCDAPGCSWRAEALAEAVHSGAMTRIVCDDSNNSPEERRVGQLNFTIEAYRGTKGTA
jgi:hypothetical protein